MENNNRDYTNGEITVFWQPKFCIHATTCYSELIEVFNPRKRPWINMQGASSEKIIEIVNKCPTDALTYKWNKDLDSPPVSKNQKTEPEMDAPVVIQVMRDGPLVITGKIDLTSFEGKVFKTYSVSSLCRCGVSNNMPFCDGTHRKIAFEG
jgi:uncharacterized Fe-S cluster protein YjdI